VALPLYSMLARSSPDLPNRQKSTAHKKSRSRLAPVRPILPHRENLLAEIHHVYIRTQTHIVGEVPAHVIGIFINHDLVRSPIPVAAMTNIRGRNAEIETTEPETSGSASCQAPDVARSEASAEMPMFPGMVQVIPNIGSARIVPDPPPVLVHVRGFGMPGLIVEVSVFFYGMRGTRRFRAMRGGRVHFAAAMTFAVFTVLRECEDAKNQGNCEKSQTFLHPSSPVLAAPRN
jgi:hypothetical protein